MKKNSEMQFLYDHASTHLVLRKEIMEIMKDADPELETFILLQDVTGMTPRMLINCPIQKILEPSFPTEAKAVDWVKICAKLLSTCFFDHAIFWPVFKYVNGQKYILSTNIHVVS